MSTNPEQLVWGTDCHEMPDAGQLLDLFQESTPDADTRRRFLVSNPERLHGFPPSEQLRKR